MSLEISFGLIVNLIINGLVIGTLVFLIAAGLSLIFGLMDVLNFAHGSLFMWGAYASVSAAAITGSFWLGLFAGALVGAVLGAAMERWTIRPLYGRPVFQLLLTVGLSLVLDEVVQMIWGRRIIGVAPPAWAAGTITFLGQPLAKYRLVILGLGLAVLVLLVTLDRYTRIGLIVRAGVENRAMVEALGINVRAVFTAVFAFGGAMAALGGAVAAPYFRSVWPQMGVANLLVAFIVVVVGGLGNFSGALLGSVLVGLSQALIGFFWPDAAIAVNMGLMALVLIVRPTGLASLWERRA